ncbi:HNH endonuclease [Clostridium botulinum]|nr:HNH endonuclease [Clostridium botulinum]NFO92487.1 HNH endonuclease [Clostridium botulinum]
MESKICTKCERKLPISAFYKDKKTKCGYRSQCKECIKIYNKTGKELKEYNNKYYEENKERLRETRKKYYEEHKEYFFNHRKKYYKDNKTKKLNLSKKWRENNREKVAAYSRKWAKNNLVKIRIKNQRRLAKKKQIYANFTEEQWRKIKNAFNNKCAYCGQELPLSQEHFVPLSKGGEYTLNNIIPSCRHCNSSKCNKDFFDWYPKYEFYSKKREQAILIFLGYKDKKQQLKIMI